MAVMFRPIKNTNKDKYEIVDYEPSEDMQDLMRFAPLDVAISASVFFWTLGSELLSSTVSYLQKETKKMTDSTNTAKGTNLENSGAGMEASMRSLKAILPSLTKLQAQDLLNVSRILPSKNRNTKLKQENLNNK